MLGPLEVRTDDSGAVLEVGGARLRDAVADPEPWVSVTALVMRGHVQVNYGRQHARAEEDFLAATGIFTALGEAIPFSRSVDKPVAVFSVVNSEFCTIMPGSANIRYVCGEPPIAPPNT
jgi:hypothetical protein